MADDERDDEAREEPTAEEPAAEAEEPAAEAEEPAAEAEEPAAEQAEAPAAEAEPAAEAAEPTAEGAPAAEKRERPKKKKDAKTDAPEVIPGEHLEPDLVLEQERAEEDEFARYADDGGEPATEEEAAAAETAPRVAATLDLAADARYIATGKRKRAIARVILKPGKGEYTVNGKPLDAYFPRPTLQVHVRQPLETAGYGDRMDVIARIHGGGVSAQATALRHGVSRALVDASPDLRTDLKRQGFLTRDSRVKERKKAGLKKARKRPQFSKR